MLPILWVAQGKGFKGDFGAAIILPVFRATALAWVTNKFPTRARAVEAVARGVDSANVFDSAFAEFASDAVVAEAAGAGDGARGAPAAHADFAAEAAIAALAATDATLTAAFAADGIASAMDADAVAADAFNADVQAIEKGLTADQLAGRKLWPQSRPKEITKLWTRMKKNLVARGEDWEVWTDWYEARLAGKPAIEALEVARVMIAEEIWQQGPKVVNEEIRKLIEKFTPAPPEDQSVSTSSIVFGDSIDAELIKGEQPPPSLEAIPEQARAATSFGLNEQGLIDRLPDPPSDETLADPAQREHYEETCFKASTLVELGSQQLAELMPLANRFLESLPEDLKDLSVSRAWSRGNTLRRRLKAHDLSMQHADPDPARLAPLVAESLRDLMDSWNVFIFGDARGRELDERRFGPREAEAIRNMVAVSKPLVEAIAQAEDVATEQARETVNEQAHAAFDAPAGLDGDQANDLSRKTTGNFVARLLRSAYSKFLTRYRSEAAFAWKEIRSGAYKRLGAALISGAGIAAMFSFIAMNAEALKAFVMASWHNPTLVDIIDLIARVVSHLS